MSDETKRWVCDQCSWIGTTKQLLRAKSPFDDSEVTACPDCRVLMDTMQELCEEPGCMYEATCGTPYGADQYKRHCRRHPPTQGTKAGET